MNDASRSIPIAPQPSRPSSSPRVPFHRVHVSGEARRAVDEVLAGGWLTAGPVTRAFETEFAARLGARHAVAVASGTAALELALRVLNMTPGDAVITTPFSFTATTEVIVRSGGVPIFADIDRASLNLSPASVEAAIDDAQAHGRRVVALLPVHIAGVPCALDALDALARAHDLAIIEDAAHAFPSHFAGRPIGARRDGGRSSAVCFSFYANKTLSTGEGGMLVTDDAAVAERVRRLSLHGIDRDTWARSTEGRSWDYEVTELGTKSNLNDIASALGRVALARTDADLEARRRIADRYREGLANLAGVELPPRDAQSSWHLYIVRVDQRDRVADELSTRGVGTSVHYRPLHLHRAYRSHFSPGTDTLSNTMAEWPRVLSLPIFPSMTDDELEHVVATLRAVCDR